MTRKVVSITLLLVGLAFTVPGQAADYTVTTNSGKITITGYTGSGGNITIPSAIEGLPVTSVGTNAFSEYSKSHILTGVTIPEGVTDIGDFAFYQCTRLTYIAIPNSGTNIGHYSINGCTSLTSVAVPGSVAGIGSYAFYGCTGLDAITVDATNSFYSSTDGVLFNKSQTALIQFPGGKEGSCAIPGSVTSIGSYAFYHCSGVTNLTIPSSVTNIVNPAFSYSGFLTIAVDPLNAYYSSMDGILFDKTQTALLQYPCGRAGSYTIPDGVTSIGSYAFRGCGGITNVVIPDSVTSLGDYAFYNCVKLKQLYFRGDIPNIGSDVFSPSDSATSYYLPEATDWDTVFAGRPAALWNPDYLLTVNGGSGGGSYTNRQQVMIAANAPSAGKIFDRWVGATQYVASTLSPSTTVTMPVPADFTLPTADVILTATYKDLYCTLIVEAAHGTAVFPAGTNVYMWGTAVTCSAERVTSDGWLFMGWAGDVSTDYTATNAVVVMDALSKSITAQYSDDADSDGLLNNIELFIGTNPRMKDTDGDKFDDGFEVAQEMNPLKDNSAVQSYIESNPETFGLYASNAVLDLAIGEVLLNAQNGQARLRLQVERSDDLQSWTNAGDAVDWSLPLDGSRKFFRIKASQ